MRYTLLYIILSLVMPVHGQISIQNDTIKISEVLISGNKISSDPPGYKKTTIDSAILRYHFQGTLAELLSETSRVLVKSYGMGGTATPSFRGTGAGHTQVAWNGINLNNPMLGQSDLSLLPVGIVDDIQIFYGGASMTLNSGGIGGILNLETKPVWKKKTLITLDQGAGSFGSYAGLLTVKSGNLRFQSVTKAFYKSSENDFSYLNTEISSVPVWEKRKNSEVRQQGLIQELYYRKSKNVASARIWYQSAWRNLSSSLLTQQSGPGEKQFDESLRVMLNYDVNKDGIKYFITGSWFMNRLNYSNNLASIESRNLSDMLNLKAGLEKRIWHNIKFKLAMNDEMNFVKSNNYNRSKERNTTILTVSAEHTGNGRIGKSILVREIFDNNKFLIPDFSAGLQFRIFDSKEYFVKTNFSRNSKIPTLNDLFWLPGGNPELKNEYAFIYELTYEMSQKIHEPLSLKYDLSFFRNSIKDMIQWHPGKYSYWTADNIQTVETAGLESSLSLEYARNNLNVILNAGYLFTEAVSTGTKFENDVSVGKQLMYIPEHQADISLRIGYNKIYSSWVTNYTGKRYTTVDNSKYLPGYIINSLVTALKFSIKGSSIDMNLNIDNFFNINYQTIEYYPLPGRSFFIKIYIQFI